ncbi:hypothetical protein [Microcoleus sp. MON2_D5]|uniref:hypothetical protein n=1 Tax=Microcoleus sp. MON2_D5 TaxID=2818833 RepID=UPI002FD2CDF3
MNVEQLRLGRHELDFYETPAWLTLLALAHIPFSGTIGEPCAGHCAIASIMKEAGFKVWCNDIDTTKPADYHCDATKPEHWATLPQADWIFSNPPYSHLSAPIVQNAYQHSRRGVVMVLRLNWFEVCADRVDFIKHHPPTLILNVPRFCYTKSAKGKWATDQCPTNLYCWDKSNISGMTRIISFSRDDIPLFYRNPDEAPTFERVKEEIPRRINKWANPSGKRRTLEELQKLLGTDKPA